MKTLPIWCSIILLAVGVILLVGGIVLFFITPSVIENRVNEAAIIDSPDHSGFEDWRKPPDNPLVFNCYFWNITNIQDVRNGENNEPRTKPILRSVGPYVYKRFQERFDITFLQDDETTPCTSNCPKVQYREWGDYVYYANESGAGLNPETDKIFTANVPYWTFLVGGNALRRLEGSALSEEILAVEGGRQLVFGELRNGLTTISSENPLNVPDFALGWFNGAAFPIAIQYGIGALVANLAVTQEVAFSHLASIWAFCGRENTDANCNGAVDPTAKAVLDGAELTNFRLFENDSFVVPPAALSGIFGPSPATYGFLNTDTIGDWLDPTKIPDILAYYMTGLGLSSDLASDIIQWRAPSDDSFDDSGRLFNTLRGLMGTLFWGNDTLPASYAEWGYLHWGRWDSAPNIINDGGIFNGLSLSQLDSETSASLFGQFPEIGLWYKNFTGEDPPNFSPALSQTLFTIWTNDAIGTGWIVSHIKGWEGLLVGVSFNEAAAVATWPTPAVDPSIVVSKQLITDGEQAKVLYYYFKQFFLAGIVDIALPALIPGVTELPNAFSALTPKDQLFGRVDPLFAYLVLIGLVPAGTQNIRGVWTDFNQATVQANPLTLDKYTTGHADPEKARVQLTYETKKDLSVELNLVNSNNQTFNSPKYFNISVEVQGSSLTFVGPYRLQKNRDDQNLFLWVPNVYRHLKLIYDRKRKLDGIDLNRYIADTEFTTVRQSPKDQYNNPENFVMDITNGFTRGQVPFLATFPHYTLVENPAFANSSDPSSDLEPNPDEFTLFWDIEPITGLAFAARAPLQISVSTFGPSWDRTDPINYVFDRWSKDTSRDLYYPIYYITRTNQATKENTDRWKESIGALLTASLAVFAIGLSLGVILILVGLIFLILRIRAQKKGDMDDFELRS